MTRMEPFLHMRRLFAQKIILLANRLDGGGTWMLARATEHPHGVTVLEFEFNDPLKNYTTPTLNGRRMEVTLRLIDTPVARTLDA